MLVLAAAMFALFRRRGWIGTGASRDAIQAERAQRQAEAEQKS
jgi:hypothetical protein